MHSQTDHPPDSPSESSLETEEDRSDSPRTSLLKWARFVDQDSQSEPSAYLEESRADRSGE